MAGPSLSSSWQEQSWNPASGSSPWTVDPEGDHCYVDNQSEQDHHFDNHEDEAEDHDHVDNQSEQDHHHADNQSDDQKDQYDQDDPKLTMIKMTIVILIRCVN